MDKTNTKTFSTPDIVIFVVMLLVSISIGLFFAFRNRNKNGTTSYFLGNRELKPLPVALSFVVTFQSSIMIIGFPAEAYAYGMQYSIQVIGIVIGYSLAALVVVPIYHPLRVTSTYHYYQLRYDENSVRYVAVSCGMVYHLLYMGTVLYGTALALQSAADFPLWLTIIVFTTATIFYTSIGGIQAVIWTDVFQCVVMLFGIMAVLISSTVKAGGVVNVFELSSDRFNFFNFNPDPTIRHTFWTLIFGSSQFFYLTISQAGVQRINSTPSMKAAKMMMLISGPVYGFIWILTMFEGVTLFAYFSNKGCDPLASGDIANVNQLIPYSMMELFHNMPGLPGLVVAALAAAALSTISSGLSGLAAITYEDIIKQIKPNIKDTTATNISKGAVVIFGIIAAGISFFIMNLQGPLGQTFASLVSSLIGPQVGLYLTSIFFSRARPKAMVFATLLGVGFVLWIGSGQNFSASIPKTPYLPLGPTSNCSIIPDNSSHDNGTLSVIGSEGYPSETNYGLNNTGVRSATEVPNFPEERTALQTFYSISYMYFNVIGTIIVVVAGVVFSLLTQPKHPPEINQNLILSISGILPCLARKRARRGKGKKRSKCTDAKSDEELQNIGEKYINNDC